MNTGTYVIITPAKNEGKYLSKTIESVIEQTLRPQKWVIVDDGSVDNTSEIIAIYAKDHDFIDTVRLQSHNGRSFRSKVCAFNAGLERLKGIDYSFIGNLDADIGLPAGYYEAVIAEFERDPALGIVGGTVYTQSGRGFVTSDTALDSVGGAVQLFRKECFEHISGYVPLQHGGIDAAAEIMARMHGWSVRKLPGIRVFEYRKTGSAQHDVLYSCYKEGIKFQSLGYSGIFFFCRCVRRISDRPFLIRSVLSLLGFAYATLRGHPACLPSRVVAYLKSEQMDKLRHSLFNRSPQISIVL